MRIGIGMACAVLLLSTGCVMKSKYESLEKQLAATTDAMQGRIDEKEGQIVELDAALAAERSRVADLESQIAELQRKHAEALRTAAADKAAVEAERDAARAEQERLSGELASVVKDRSRLKGSVEDMKQALAELEARKRAAEARIAEFKGLLDRFKPLMDAGRLRVQIIDGRMVVVLATDVLFGSGSARLSKEGKEAVAEVGALLASMADKTFQVEGHTDDVPIATKLYPSNWELAAARSITVTKTMVEAGMPAERISAASFGQNRPAQPNDTKEGRAANRRIEIVLVPDLSSLPGFEELKKLGGS